jgi:membrane protein
MAALPIFMVWLYLSWLIVLIGVELAFVHQNLRNLRQEILGGEVNIASRERAALAIMLTVTTVFNRGEAALTQGELALRIGIPARLARSLVEQLVRLGYLVEVVTTDDITAFQPARPAATMPVIDLLTALRDDGVALPPGEATEELAVAGGMQQRLLAGMAQVAAGVTLQQLADEAGTQTGEGKAKGGFYAVNSEKTPSSQTA